MMFSLEGKIAVVTGSGSGIGLATSRRFISAGAKVVMADIADASAQAEKSGAVFIKTDVSKEEQVKALMNKTAETHGRIDIVINNAGRSSRANFLPQVPAEDFFRDFETNLMGVVFGMKHAVDYMLNGGSMINTASVAGLQGAPTYGPYAASKAAIIGVTKTAALEYAPRKIRVNCVCPGTVDTPMAYAEGDEAELKLAPMMMPLGRLCRPEEVAALFHFLAADDCSFIAGQAICIDGGMTAGISLGIIGPLMATL